MSEGWFKLLEHHGPEPEINQLELARTAGINYKTVKNHIKAGFVAKNHEHIVRDFRFVAEKYAASPRLMAIQLETLLEKHKTWLSIESKRKSYQLWERLQAELHDTIMDAWSATIGKNTEAHYALFWLCIIKLAEDWRLHGYDGEIKRTLEQKILSLYNSCSAGNIEAASSILAQ